MSGSGKDKERRAEDAVEALLERATPRPAPPSQDRQMVREAVYAEWRAVTGRRSRRRRVAHFAIAATVLLAATIVFNQFRVNEVAPVHVASISKSHGSIYLLGDQSELRELPDSAAISAGQTIVTGADAGIGLDWGNGGSLRVDANSRIEFISPDAVFLRSGRIYFDSQSAEAVAPITSSGSGISALKIETGHGTVTHSGTQFMTFVDDDRLLVAVREGEVAIAGTYHDGTAVAGQEMTIQGRARPSITNHPVHGSAWAWAESTAPDPRLDGKSVDTFLRWVSHETGLRLEYEGDKAERLAMEERFLGNVKTGPTEALETWMMAIDLDYRVAGGAIYVSAIDPSSGQ